MGFDQSWTALRCVNTGAAVRGGAPCQICTEPRIVLRALAFLTTCATPVIIRVRCRTSEKVRTLRQSVRAVLRHATDCVVQSAGDRVRA